MKDFTNKKLNIGDTVIAYKRIIFFRNNKKIQSYKLIKTKIERFTNYYVITPEGRFFPSNLVLYKSNKKINNKNEFFKKILDFLKK
jgi:hypothetical protein